MGDSPVLLSHLSTFPKIDVFFHLGIFSPKRFSALHHAPPLA
jgi:hypothetical protein